MGAEQNVRVTAAALLLAVSEAKASGLVIQWPSKPEGLASLAISETSRTIRATVTNLDGSPVERDADGLIHGKPLNLTDEERAALPPLSALDGDEPPVLGISKPTGKRKRS